MTEETLSEETTAEPEETAGADVEELDDDELIRVLEALLLVYGPGEAAEQLECLEREAAEAIPEPKSWAKESQ